MILTLVVHRPLDAIRDWKPLCSDLEKMNIVRPVIVELCHLERTRRIKCLMKIKLWTWDNRRYRDPYWDFDNEAGAHLQDTSIPLGIEAHGEPLKQNLVGCQEGDQWSTLAKDRPGRIGASPPRTISTASTPRVSKCHNLDARTNSHCKHWHSEKRPGWAELVAANKIQGANGVCNFWRRRWSLLQGLHESRCRVFADTSHWLLSASYRKCKYPLAGAHDRRESCQRCGQNRSRFHKY